MDGKRPAPGEIKLGGELRLPKPVASPWDEIKAAAIVGGVVLVLGFLPLFFGAFETSSSSGSEFRASAPEVPLPPTKYAAFVGSTPDQESRFAVVVGYRRLIVETVKHVPKPILESAAIAGVATGSELNAASVIVVPSDVDVEVGDLVAGDSLKARLELSHGELGHMWLVLLREPRGPPSGVEVRDPYETEGSRILRQWDAAIPWRDPPTLHVYVVGRVRTFAGPVQFDRSVMSAQLVDLSPSSGTLERHSTSRMYYEQEMFTYRKSMPNHRSFEEELRRLERELAQSRRRVK